MITVNETGFLPEAVKLAVSDRDGNFWLSDDNEGKRLDIGVVVIPAGYDETAGCEVYRLDFSGVSEPGIYHLESEEGDSSASFKVEPHVYRTLKNALLKAFYFQRCGSSLQEKHAGIYKRGACHLDRSKFLENKNLSKDLCGGWHDAGDFGKYSSAASVTLGHLLYAFELFPEAFMEEINIPESGNGIPDILNECRYELDFLCKMQGEDGGVYHKVTPLVFCGFIMPEEETGEQLIFPVTSLSTADFAAVMCIASRVYYKYDPAFARNCLHQAYMAGQWLIRNPENTDFHNPEGCITGEYTDTCDTDERMWAFAELLRTDNSVKNEGDRSILSASSQKETRQDVYLKELKKAMENYDAGHPHSDGRSVDDGFGWQDVSAMAAAAVVFDPLNMAGDDIRDRMTEMLTERADAFVAMQEAGYPLGMETEDFVWGSNMVVSNRADVMILASLALRHRIDLIQNGQEQKESVNIKAVELSRLEREQAAAKYTEEDISSMELDMEVYEEAALNHLHYILGMNAMDTSYVTGFGDNAFKDPHNRTAIADGIERPIPGEMSGGPCTLIADEEIKKKADEDTPPQKCYVDHHMSYSTNEIAIYWNSSLLFAAAYFDR